MTPLPRVALIGRANVGKSTLFNRFTHGPRALVSRVAGTTRDRKESECYWSGKRFLLIDTGGLDIDAHNPIEQKVSKQAATAAAQADLILFMVDTKAGITSTDRTVAHALAADKKRTLLIANKVDAPRDESAAAEFYRLGFGNPWPVSAISGAGTGDLLDEIGRRIEMSEPEETKRITITIVGKPNVGKSSLANALAGEERFIVHSEPYTTRDANAIPLTVAGEPVELMDTAGIRRKSKINPSSIESESAHQSLTSIRHADVVLLVTEVQTRLTAQDLQLARMIYESQASAIIIANKWDLIEDKTPERINKFEDYYLREFNVLDWAPVVFLSAQQKTKMPKLKEAILAVYKERFREITENALSKFLKGIIKRHPPTTGKGSRKPYIERLKQVGINPPQFVVRIKENTSLNYTYLDFIEGQLRKKFGFTGSPIKIWVEKGIKNNK